MSITSESDERMTPNNGEDSPSLDDANVEGNVGGNGPLKKGPWTSAEDAVLVEYVNKHGEGNWNAVQKHSGLARCGKSCRLRWANHLRPDLKKGAFTPEEERRIIELHFKMGNKWARMAAELPGRTDNEIKNFWNTRIKRRQRQGLPMYPPDLCLQSLNDSQHGDSMNNFSSGDVHHHQDLMPVNDLDIPAVEFKNQVNAPALLDFPASNLLDLLKVSTVHPSKRLRGSESSIHGLNTPICNVYTGGSQYQSDCPMSFVQSCLFENATSSSLPSVSDPTWAMKLELPSLQNQMGTLGSPSPSSPFLESVDALMQTPPNEHMQTCNLSSQNSGLLDAVLYESTKKPKSYGTSRMDHLAHGYNEAEWEPYNDQLSPCTSSVFNESTPIGRTSLDEQYSTGALPEDASNGGQVPSDDRVETNNPMMISRPDFLLGSNYFHPIGTLFGDDLSRDCKKVDAEATLSTQGHAHDSGAWSVMPTV